MSQDPESLIGRVLADTYELERLLDTGGMAAVFAARHLRTGGLCAVKVLSAEATSNLEIYERFQDEARISCSLRHPNIVQVMDLNQMPDGTPFLVMELLEGEDLHDRLQQRGRLGVPEVLRLARQVGSALHAVHSQDVVHRDLKPQNIFLARSEIDGRLRETVKLLDFGLSKIRRPASRATRDQLVLGTPRYLAPEAALGQNSQLDGRADQFSLAVILYRALSGRLPFDSDEVAEVLRQVVYDEPLPLGELAPEVPEQVCAAVTRALRKDKEQRFASMLDFIEGLGALPEEPTVTTPALAGRRDDTPPLRAAAPTAALTGITVSPPGLGAAPRGTGRGFTDAPTFVAPLSALVPQRSGDSEAAAVREAGPGRARTPTRPSPVTGTRETLLVLAWPRTAVGFAAGAALATPLLLLLHPSAPPRAPTTLSASGQAARLPRPAPPQRPDAPRRPLPSRPPPTAAVPPAAAYAAYPPLRIDASTPAPPPSTATAEVLLADAQAALRRGAPLQALALAHAALGLHPADPEPARRVLGAAAFRAGRLRTFNSVYSSLSAAAQAELERDCLMTPGAPSGGGRGKD